MKVEPPRALLKTHVMTTVSAVVMTTNITALATLGGVQRAGNLLGPLLGAGAITVLDLDGAYVTHVVLAVAAPLVGADTRTSREWSQDGPVPRPRP